ncbi:hypothetical protein DMX02_18105 [Pseudomonas jessenii]|nr:hypothetical protein DMX02_18105 [Pseudomonas jessenii]
MSLLAIAVYQSIWICLTHRYREQAHSYSFDRWGYMRCFCGSGMLAAPSTAGSRPERKSPPLGC